MNNYPPAVVEKAQCLAELLERVEQGEPSEQAGQELGLTIVPDQLTTLRRKYQASGGDWQVLLDGRYGHDQKANDEIKAWLYARKQAEPSLTAPQLVEEIKAKFAVEFSAGHVNYLLRKVALTRPPVVRRSARKLRSQPPQPSQFPGPMLGFFSLEAAKGAMDLIKPIERCLSQVSSSYQTAHPTSPLRLLSSRPETIWSKIDHLLYLPILNLVRPRDLYWEQGAGLEVLYGFTYKYLPLEQFLGQLTRLGLGSALLEPLARAYSQAWYAGSSPLVIFSDWHVKPHWTKHLSQSGSVTMVGRVMPGTKQLFINGSGGHILVAWNEPIDAHFSRVLLERETQLATILNRPLAYNVLDSEGGGLPLAQQYQQAEHWYLSILPRGQHYPLALFHLVGDWQAVVDDPQHEAVEAIWADELKAAADPRRLILLRPVGASNPTRIYAGHIPASLTAAVVPACHRQRWTDQERRFREMIGGANLNANYGYRYQLVPHRTRQRQWQAAQEQVERSQNRLLEREQAIRHLQAQLQHLGQTQQQIRADLLTQATTLEIELQQRQQAGQKTGHLRRSLARCQRQLLELQQRHRQRWHKLFHQLGQHCQQAYPLRQRLADQEAERDAIDTDTLCRERQLEKDQIMLNWQVMLTHLHDWACHNFFAPAWQNLELETATRLIYRKAGQVTWLTDRIEVTLDSYRYPEHQQAMEISCHRFNQAHLRWRDGRLLRIYVDKPA